MQRFSIKTGNTYKEPLGSQMAKVMGQLKHNYNAFPELRTKFFHKQCAIWSFSPSFNEFHHKLHTFEISGRILEKLTMRIQVITTGISH